MKELKVNFFSKIGGNDFHHDSSEIKTALLQFGEIHVLGESGGISEFILKTTTDKILVQKTLSSLGLNGEIVVSEIIEEEENETCY